MLALSKLFSLAFYYFVNSGKLIFMDMTIGEIRLFAGNFAPRDWAFCNGQTMSINENQALFSILGTQYGGDAQ